MQVIFINDAENSWSCELQSVSFELQSVSFVNRKNCMPVHENNITLTAKPNKECKLNKCVSQSPMEGFIPSYERRKIPS